jgi:hypothetical protein
VGNEEIDPSSIFKGWMGQNIISAKGNILDSLAKSKLCDLKI